MDDLGWRSRHGGAAMGEPRWGEPLAVRELWGEGDGEQLMGREAGTKQGMRCPGAEDLGGRGGGQSGARISGGAREFLGEGGGSESAGGGRKGGSARAGRARR